MWRDGELVAEEVHTLHVNYYFKNEILLLLEQVGFEEIVVHGDHSEEPPTANSDFLVFVAHKRYG